MMSEGEFLREEFWIVNGYLEFILYIIKVRDKEYIMEYLMCFFFYGILMFTRKEL